jgi:hypothetical protein
MVSMRNFFLVGVLVAGALAVGVQVGAQSALPNRGQLVVPDQQIVLAGADVGFLVERLQGDTPVGRLVVRVKGEWVEPLTSAKIRPAK